MTDALSPTVPAGWYPDPWGSVAQRWWDGFAWTSTLYPQPDAPTPDREEPPVAAVPGEQPPAGVPQEQPTFTDSAVAGGTDDKPGTTETPYEPVSVRSTYEAPAYASAPAPGTNMPLPSRRALRELAVADDAPAALEDDLAALELSMANQPAPGFTQAPEYTPEPVSALPPPVWTEVEEADVSAALSASPAPPASTALPAELPPSEPAAQSIPAVAPAAEVTVASVASVTDAPTVAPISAAPIAGHPDDSWAQSLAKWDDVELSTSSPEALPIFGDAPPVSYSQRAMRYQPLHGRTSPVWLIVLMPLIHAAAVVGSLFLFPDALGLDASLQSFQPDRVDPAALGEWLLFAAAPLGIAFFVFTLVMGFQDRARLRLLGHDHTASPWWIVLHPLIYLIVRSVRVRQCTGRRGSVPLTTYLCFYVAPPIAIAVATVVVSALDGAIPA